MVEETRLEAALDELNGALGGVTPYRLALVSPGEVAHAPVLWLHALDGQLHHLVDQFGLAWFGILTVQLRVH